MDQEYSMDTNVSKKTRAARKARGDIDLVGQRFGKLAVTSFAGYAKGRGQWNCKCDCGNEIVVHTSALRSGNTTSCRCRVDLTGQRFGELEVIGFDHQDRGKDSYWICQCDCGETTVASNSNLVRGHIKSCGHIKSLVGQRFGRLVVTSLAFVEVSSYWNCQCDCGNTVIVVRNGLTTGNTRSCGCLQLESATTHGCSKSEVYPIWLGILRRCENPNYSDYGNYGGRGITVCERWHDVNNFVEDVGIRPEGYQLDRIDNNGPYSPENCRWVTPKENSRNTRKTRLITYKGVTQCLSAWAEDMGVKPEGLAQRLKRGWSIERTLTTPGLKYVD